jgi:FkbM family methyltransferase
VNRSRTTAAALVDLACRVATRRHVVRAARFTLNRARLDIPNDITANGEVDVQHAALRVAPSGAATVLDVGANVGEWSLSMVGLARTGGRTRDLRLHAFEPSAYTVDRLRSALGSAAVVNHSAVSDRVGEATLHVVHPGAGTNSLIAAATAAPASDTEVVPLTTVDAYCADHGIDEIALVKVDTEGHDMAVLRGASGLFAAGRIALAQFEYNHRWIPARSYLRDAFDLLTPWGYRIGKITPRGIETYPGWDPELESFVEGNYLAFRSDAAAVLRQVPWWKANG